MEDKETSNFIPQNPTTKMEPKHIIVKERVPQSQRQGCQTGGALDKQVACLVQPSALPWTYSIKVSVSGNYHNIGRCFD
jgi:hypothetical protein